MSGNTYHISDIFHTRIDSLKADVAASILFKNQNIEKNRKDGHNIAVGMEMFSVLRLLSKKKKLFKKIDPDNMADIYDSLDIINQKWYSFHVTYIKTKYGKLLPPEEKCGDFTFFQFVKADAEYSKFLVAADTNMKETEHYLNRFVAILYRPSVDGEKLDFDKDYIDSHAKALPSALTFDLKYLILRTYGNVRSYIIRERCTDLFEVPASGQHEEKTHPVYTGEMWNELMFDASDTAAFQGLEIVKKTNMYEVLDYLNSRAAKAKKRKKV